MAVLFDYILSKLRLKDASGGSGTVTSVGLALPSIFAISGSPVTTSGTLTGTLATQTANLVFAGPGTGAAATPTFRALVAADIPSLTGSYANRALSNLASVGVNVVLVPSAAGSLDFGSNTRPWRDIYFAGTSASPATNFFRVTGVSTSGTLTVTFPDGSGTVAYNAVAFGGTGVNTLTAYAVLAGGTTSTGAIQQVSGLGTTGFVLTSNGIGALPTWQAAPGATYAFSTGLTNTAGTITADISTGVSFGQAIYGGTGAGENLRIFSTAHITKGSIVIGNSLYEESTDRLALNTTVGSAFLTVGASTSTYAALLLKRGSTPTTPGDCGIWYDSTPRSVIINHEPKTPGEVHMEAVPGIVFVQTQHPFLEIVNTDAVTSLFGTGKGSLTIKKERLTEGKNVVITIRGIISTTFSSPGITLTFTYKGVIVQTIVPFISGTLSAVPFVLTIDVTSIIVSAQQGISTNGMMLIDDVLNGAYAYVVPLVDPVGTALGAGTDVIQVDFQWSVADPGNDLVVTNAYIEIKNQTV